MFILFIWLHQVLVVARRIFIVACGLLAAACMQDLVPRPAIEPGPPALAARSLTHQGSPATVMFLKQLFLNNLLRICLCVICLNIVTSFLSTWTLKQSIQGLPWWRSG